ncbi:hypothetical protein KY314_02580, partial [Candidatus Woesearchaeota archaeon]|nr:hypothetical protein [Candidatus Woesearchaeota archaeon]
MFNKDNIIDKKKTLSLLRDIDSCLEGIQRKIKLYCVGGTLLVLSDIKFFSNDVDFIASYEDYRTISSHTAEIEWKNKIRFDVFSDGAMPNYAYPYYYEHATKAPFIFDNINLYYLDEVDLILTKAIAGRPKDYEDILLITNFSKNIPKEEFIERFKKIKPNQNK